MDPKVTPRRHGLTSAATRPAPSPMRWMAAHKAMARHTVRRQPPAAGQAVRLLGANPRRERAAGREAPGES